MNVMLLGNTSANVRVLNSMENRGCDVTFADHKLVDHIGNEFDLIVSYGYRHILSSSFLTFCNCPVVNLHISYLPFNRGAHPNFWSFFDDTEKGVSIHLVDGGIDTGPILFQKGCTLGEGYFRQTYEISCHEIEDLYRKSRSNNRAKLGVPTQRGEGSFHRKSELPKDSKAGTQTSKTK